MDLNRVVYTLLSVVPPKDSTAVAALVAEAELAAVDDLNSISAATMACNRLYSVIENDSSMTGEHHLNELMRSIDAGVVGAWSVMFEGTADTWDGLHHAIRRLPQRVRAEHDRIIGVFFNHAPNDLKIRTTDPPPRRLHPRKD